MQEKDLQETQPKIMKPLKVYNKPKLLFSHVTQHTLDPRRNMDTENVLTFFFVDLLAFTVIDHVDHIDADVGWVPARWATPRACTLHLRPASPASRAFKSRGRVLSELLADAILPHVLSGTHIILRSQDSNYRPSSDTGHAKGTTREVRGDEAGSPWPRQTRARPLPSRICRRRLPCICQALTLSLVLNVSG